MFSFLRRHRLRHRLRSVCARACVPRGSACYPCFAQRVRLTTFISLQKNVRWLPDLVGKVLGAAVRRQPPTGLLEEQGLYTTQRPLANPLIWFHANTSGVYHPMLLVICVTWSLLHRRQHSFGCLCDTTLLARDCCDKSLSRRAHAAPTPAAEGRQHAPARADGGHRRAGECVLCLPLIHRVVVEYNEKVLILVTVRCNDTLELLRTSLPERVLLVRAPTDADVPVSRFLRHWRPCIGVMVTAELAPNLILTSRAVCPLPPSPLRTGGCSVAIPSSAHSTLSCNPVVRARHLAACCSMVPT